MCSKQQTITTNHSKNMKTNITKKQFFAILDAAAYIQSINGRIANREFPDQEEVLLWSHTLKEVAYDLLPDDEEDETMKRKLPAYVDFGFEPEEAS